MAMQKSLGNYPFMRYTKENLCKCHKKVRVDRCLVKVGLCDPL